MRTGNPVFGTGALDRGDIVVGEPVMTLQGTINRVGVLLVLVVVAAAFVWNQSLTAGAEAVMPWMIGGLIGGLVLALITIFSPKSSPFTSPIYALFEGAFLGALSAMMELRFPGIVIQAVALTFGTMFALLILYSTRIIRVSDKFRAGVVAATGAIFLVYLVTMVLHLFGVSSIGFIHGRGLVSIGFSLFVVGIAALNLVLDFDFIERGVRSGAPKHMEWYGAFGLLVTLVWLYIEILRLLSKLNRR